MSTYISRDVIASINYSDNLTRLNKGTLSTRGPVPGGMSAVNKAAVTVDIKDSAAAARMRDSAVISLEARDKAAHEQLMKDLSAERPVE